MFNYVQESDDDIDTNSELLEALPTLFVFVLRKEWTHPRVQRVMEKEIDIFYNI